MQGCSSIYNMVSGLSRAPGAAACWVWWNENLPQENLWQVKSSAFFTTVKVSKYCASFSDYCIKHVSQITTNCIAQGGQNEESRVGEGQGRTGGSNSPSIYILPNNFSFLYPLNICCTFLNVPFCRHLWSSRAAISSKSKLRMDPNLCLFWYPRSEYFQFPGKILVVH